MKLANTPVRLQRYQVLRTYSIYRIALAIMLLTIFWSGLGNVLLGNTSEYFDVAVYALLVVGIAGLSVPFRLPFDPSYPEVVGWLLVDILALIILIRTTGDYESSLIPLLSVVVVAGGILLQGQLSILIAAIATIGILSLAIFDKARIDNAAILFNAASWGVGWFTMAFVVQLLSKRLYNAIAREEAKAAIIEELQMINSRIIERMNTGVLVIDGHENLLQLNPSARRLLDITGKDVTSLSDLPAVAKAYHKWCDEDHHFNQELNWSEVGVLRVGFVEFAEQGDTLIFLEDAARTRYRAQQMKLSSLGHLSAGIAHEIRNPLGAISYARELLAESPRLNEEDQTFLETISRQEQRIDRIISKTFELASTKPAKQQSIELSQFIDTFIEEYRELNALSSRDIQVDIESLSYTVSFDGDHLRQVMINLLDNARRYGKLPIIISARIALGSVSLDVRDQGEAKTKAIAEKLFDPFYSESKESTGIGLYLCQQMCQVNRAALVYSAHEGKSRFSLIISIWEPSKVASSNNN